MFLSTLNITDIVVQLTHKKHREARRMATTDQTNEDQTNAPNEDQTHEDDSTTDKEDFQKSMLEDNKYKRKPNTTMRAMIEEHIIADKNLNINTLLAICLYQKCTIYFKNGLQNITQIPKYQGKQCMKVYSQDRTIWGFMYQKRPVRYL